MTTFLCIASALGGFLLKWLIIDMWAMRPARLAERFGGSERVRAMAEQAYQYRRSARAAFQENREELWRRYAFHMEHATNARERERNAAMADL